MKITRTSLRALIRESIQGMMAGVLDLIVGPDTTPEEFEKIYADNIKSKIVELYNDSLLSDPGEAIIFKTRKTFVTSGGMTAPSPLGNISTGRRHRVPMKGTAKLPESIKGPLTESDFDIYFSTREGSHTHLYDIGLVPKTRDATAILNALATAQHDKFIDVLRIGDERLRVAYNFQYTDKPNDPMYQSFSGPRK